MKNFFLFIAPILGAIVLVGLSGRFWPDAYPYMKYGLTFFVLYWCFLRRKKHQ